MEQKQFSLPQSPRNLLSEGSSFINGHSVLESVWSEADNPFVHSDPEDAINLLPADEIDDDGSLILSPHRDQTEHKTEDKLRGEYSKTDFKLSVDFLPSVTIENSENEDDDESDALITIENSDHSERSSDSDHRHQAVTDLVQSPENLQNLQTLQTTNLEVTIPTESPDGYAPLFSDSHGDVKWQELPNVVPQGQSLESKLEHKNIVISAANDTFLSNIAKEIELLDEELSSMGLLTEEHSRVITEETSRRITKANSTTGDDGASCHLDHGIDGGHGALSEEINELVPEEKASEPINDGDGDGDGTPIMVDHEESVIEFDAKAVDLPIEDPQRESPKEAQSPKDSKLSDSQHPDVITDHVDDHSERSENEGDGDDEDDIEIIKDKLSLLRKSLVFKRKTIAVEPDQSPHRVPTRIGLHLDDHPSTDSVHRDHDQRIPSMTAPNPQNTDSFQSPVPSPKRNADSFHSPNPKTTNKSKTQSLMDMDPADAMSIYTDHFGDFLTVKHKNSFFDPFASPLSVSRSADVMGQSQQSTQNLHCPSPPGSPPRDDHDKENEPNPPIPSDGNERAPERRSDGPIHHENATKIQNQWKKFQFKSILMATFNRHLKQSQQNALPVTITDLITSTTHEIVDHAEKLFAAVHQRGDNPFKEATTNSQMTIGNFRYGQLHFYSSPALDWSSVYSRIESMVLRNLLHSKRKIVNSILDTQAILDDIISSNTKSNADFTLIDQLTTQLIQLKSKLYASCQTNMECNIAPLRLFPNNADIFKSHSRSTNHSANHSMNHSMNHSGNQSVNQSMNHSVNHSVNQSIALAESQSFPCSQPPTTQPSGSPSKLELREIKNQLSLLRKSFSQRRRNVGKIRSSIRISPKLSDSLRSSIQQVNGQVDSLCNSVPPVNPSDIKRIQLLTDRKQQIASHPNDPASECEFTFHDDVSSRSLLPPPPEQRPLTAPNVSHHQSDQTHQSHQSRSNSLPRPSNDSRSPPVVTKKPFLKKRNGRRMMAKKVDWSHVKPKTVSRLSQDVRACRNTGPHRGKQKPNVINWKKRATSRVDCSWSSDKYRPSNVPPERSRRSLRSAKAPKPSKVRESARTSVRATNASEGRSRSKGQSQNAPNQFVDSYHNISSKRPSRVDTQSTSGTRKGRTVQMTDDEYLFYLKKGNKIGKIPRDAANAQLQQGSGDMIICPQSTRSASSRSYAADEGYDGSISNAEVRSSSAGVENDYERYLQEDSSSELHTENQLKELQRTFAAIEQAMKQRRQQKRS